jgi:type I restriction enzyme S subunit
MVSTRAPIGYIVMNEVVATTNQGMKSVIPNTELVNPDYLYYLLRTKVIEMNIKAGGTTFKEISTSVFKGLKVTLPIMEEQNLVGYKLSKIDEKIELINTLICDLEEYSQLLFHKWFVDFNFADVHDKPYKNNGGRMKFADKDLIPHDWTTMALSESANFLNGLAMQKYPPKNDSDLLPVIKIREINNNGFNKNTEYISKTVDSNFIINNGDILFPWSGSLSVKIWTGGVGGLNQHIFKVQSDKFEQWYIFHWINYHMRYFEQIAYGKKTTMGHINRKHLELVNVFIPDEATLKKMNDIMGPIYAKIVSLNVENRLLAECRDLLIKKLIK